MRLKYYPNTILILLISIAASSCGGFLTGQNVESPTEYDLNKPERFKMREDLLEVSGITFHNGDPDIIYAIQDEDGRVYHFRPGDAKPGYTHFGKQGDYEDVTVLNDNVIVLKSNGTFYSFPLANIKQEEQNDVKQLKDLLPKGEYEGLYADESAHKLYVLCKNCGAKKSDKIDGGYIFTADGDS
ncbi:MAG: SdiA-regulated family protein, partial [Sphingobacteriales bacterium]